MSEQIIFRAITKKHNFSLNYQIITKLKAIGHTPWPEQIEISPLKTSYLQIRKNVV